MEVPFEQGLFPSKLQLMLEGINRQMALVGKPRKMRLFQHIDTMEHHDSDSDSNSDIETDVLSTVLLLLLQQPSRRPPTPSNRRWTCKGVVDDLLTCGNPTRIHNQLRMQLDTFFQLRDWIVANTELKGSRDTSIEEKLVIFMYIASTSASNRTTQERFNRSARSVSLYINTSLYSRTWLISLGSSMKLLTPF
jgi:hypothetical protein